jgi:hypothetical protein
MAYGLADACVAWSLGKEYRLECPSARTGLPSPQLIGTLAPCMHTVTFIFVHLLGACHLLCHGSYEQLVWTPLNNILYPSCFEPVKQ